MDYIIITIVIIIYLSNQMVSFSFFMSLYQYFYYILTYLSPYFFINSMYLVIYLVVA